MVDAFLATKFTVGSILKSLGRYLFHVEEIVEELELQRDFLELIKDRVQNNVDEAKRQTEVTEKAVQEWLKEVEKELEDVRSLEAKIERQTFFNSCPNYVRRYRLRKEVAKRILHITELLHWSFVIWPDLDRSQEIEFFIPEDFMPSKSSESSFEGIIEALKTNSVNMVGLYGMPGVGKTILAKVIEKEAKKRLFYKVVTVTMSETPNISKIQARIAELLSLKFEASTEEEKAKELEQRLKEVSKILIIFDNVCNEFRLKTIGIPYGVEHKDCKILLTTHGRHVCDQMNCQKIFQLENLSEDESRTLFNKNAGLTDASTTLNNVAKEVASKCKGLPLAIVTIAKALKGAPPNKWEATNMLFNEARDDIQSSFLLSSLFPKGNDVGVVRLVLFRIVNGLFSNDYSIEDLRTKDLQSSDFLSKVDDDKIRVKGQDVAHWIILKEEDGFMVKQGLTEWPASESFECYTSICFWDSNINNFPDKLKFSKLENFVFTGKNLVRIPIAFVKGMEVLQMLYLKNVIFSLEVFELVKNLRTLYFKNCELENFSSLKNLENLEILALLDTNIFYLPEELLALHGLKSLHFSCSGDQQSNFPPNLLSRLTSLQELHVPCANNVNLSELNSLSGLTALSLRVSTAQCRQENFEFPKLQLQRYFIAVNANENLPYMQGLKFRTLKIKDFSLSLSAFKELFCNVEKLTLERCRTVECLMDTTRENRPTTAIFSNLVELIMKDLPSLKELCHGPLPIGFLSNLKDVSISGCEQLKVVFQIDGILESGEITGHNPSPLLSHLTSLHLHSLPELQNVWKFPSTHDYDASLRSLELLDISFCNKLEEVFDFPPAMAELEIPGLRRLALKSLESLTTFCSREVSFESLEELEVEACPHLLSISGIIRRSQVKDLHLFGVMLRGELCEDQGGYSLSRLEKLTLKEVNELEFINKDPSQIVTLQNLSRLTVYKCNKLSNKIFSVRLARNLPQLNRLEVEECEELEQVVAQDEISPSSSMAPQEYVCFPTLEVVCIKECNKLRSLFPVSFCRLPKLKILRVECASNLRKIFGHDSDANMTKDEKLNEVLLPTLEELVLENLPNLFWLATGGYCFVFPALIKLRVIKCPRTIMKFSSIHDDSKGSYVRPKIEESRLSEKGRAGSSITIRDIQIDCNRNIKWDHPEKGELVPGKRNLEKETRQKQLYSP